MLRWVVWLTLLRFLASAAGAQTPSINSGGVLNAASYIPGTPVAPGSVAAVFGSFGLSSPAQASNLPLPTNLLGLEMQFGSVLAPLFYASAGQVNLQVPWELAGQAQTSLAVSVNSQPGGSINVNLAPFSPGLFSVNAEGNGQGAILNSAYQLVDSSHPAIAGSDVVQIYGTGLGPVTNQPADGAAAPSTPPAQTTTLPMVTIGGVPAVVQFSGLAPTLVGVYQINALVPSDALEGDTVPVSVSMGGLTSNTVTLAVTGGGTPSGAWSNFAHDAQHTGQSAVASQPLKRIRWQTPVDLNPQYSGGELLIHYGSPLVTAANTVIVPVKTGATGGFRVEAHNGADGSLVWSMPSAYSLPAAQWTPEFGPALTPQARVYFPESGGRVDYRDNPDSGAGPTGQLAFYGLSNYQQNPSAYDANVLINTPITADAAGNIYFGFLVTGATPLPLSGGIARIGADGQGAWVAASSVASDPAITQTVDNCAPAVNSNTGILYVAVSNGGSYSGAGYLVALDSQTLAPIGRIRLKDPVSGFDALLTDSGSAAPTIGTDGDVYYGVLENPFEENHDRGWLLHFDARLTQLKTPGAFGWDEAVSLVPASTVPSYAGQSSYLLMTKYNDYGGPGAPASYRIAVIDPNATETDPITGATVMKEVLTVANAKEWCINSAAVDPATLSILANSEDGKLYRWDLAANTLSESVVLTPGIGEAYTPTLIGADGTVYAINNATLFAVGQ